MKIEPNALAHLLDEQAIIKVTVAYCWAIDANQYDDLRHVFLPDATAKLGDTEHTGIDAIIARIDAALTPLDDSQHIVGSHQVQITGDTATSRCYLHAQHIRHAAEGGGLYVVAGRYEDQLRRTAAGWRIARRDLIVMWTSGNRAVMAGPRQA